MEVDEHTALPCIPQVTVPVQPLETSTSSTNLQVSEMAYICALVRKHVSSEVCPLPPESPSVSQPKFNLVHRLRQGRKTLVFQPRPLRLSHLPRPSLTAASYFAIQSVTQRLWSVGDQHTFITTLDSCGPGAWTTAGKLFTPTLPSVDKYKPECYRLDTLSCGRDERQISSIASSPSVLLPTRNYECSMLL
jgi:hypothetical protein